MSGYSVNGLGTVGSKVKITDPATMSASLVKRSDGKINIDSDVYKDIRSHKISHQEILEAIKESNPVEDFEHIKVELNNLKDVHDTLSGMISKVEAGSSEEILFHAKSIVEDEMAVASGNSPYKHESEVRDWNNLDAHPIYKKEDVNCWIRPEDNIPSPQALLEVKETSPNLEDFTGIQGCSIKEIVSRIPKNALMRELSPKLDISQGESGFDIESKKLTHVGKGFEYSWKDKDGSDFVVRIHGIDHSQKAGNASTGWTARVEKGNETLSSEGIWYDKKTTLTKDEKIQVNLALSELNVLMEDKDKTKGLSPENELKYQNLLLKKQNALSPEDTSELRELTRKKENPLSEEENTMFTALISKIRNSNTPEEAQKLSELITKRENEPLSSDEQRLYRTLSSKKGAPLTEDEKEIHRELKNKVTNPLTHDENETYLRLSSLRESNFPERDKKELLALEKERSLPLLPREGFIRIQQLKKFLDSPISEVEFERRMNSIHIPIAV